MKPILFLGTIIAVVGLTQAVQDEKILDFGQDLMKLAAQLKELPSPTLEEQRDCAAKYSVSMDIKLTPELSEDGQCAYECGAEKAGIWQDGHPVGALQDIKEILEYILEKYGDLDNPAIDGLSRFRDCYTPSDVSGCAKFAKFMWCIINWNKPL